MTVGATDPGPVIEFIKTPGSLAACLARRRCTRHCLLLRTSLSIVIRISVDYAQKL